MFTLSGEVVAILNKQIKNGENAGKSYPVYQVMFGGESFKQILNVSDFNDYSFTVGSQVTVPVRVKPFSYRNGSVGLDIMTLLA